MEKIKFIDLFAGTGGVSYILEKNNLKCVFANDILDSSEKIYNANHVNKITKNDIHNINVKTIPSHNLLIGGFPCQPFSIAGKKEGFNDDRSNVFWKIIDILKDKKPKYFILENVKNLETHDKGKTFKKIKENLEKLKYHIKWEILDTSKITEIPHHRERIFIIGAKSKKDIEKINFSFPKKTMKNIEDYLEKNIDDKYYYTNRFKIYDIVKKDVTKNISTNTVYQFRRHYVRENKGSCVPCLTANMGTGGHNVPLILDNKGVRKLTPRECFNLQGFPEDYKLPEIGDSKLYSLAGNAITLPIIELIIHQLLL